MAGLNGGRCQELIALGCSAGPRVYSTLSLSLRRAEEALSGGRGAGGGGCEAARISEHGMACEESSACLSRHACAACMAWCI